MKQVFIVIISILILGTNAVHSQTELTQNPKTQWFTDARFGMFIHFGLYSIPAGVWNGTIMGRNMYAEWIQKQGNWPFGIPDKEYQALAKQFNPVKFNAEEWVLEARNAGMKYIVITTKHHDGFALWPSKVSKYNVMATPFKRDILDELSKACKKYQMKLGFYYSHWLDWEHEGGARPSTQNFASVPPPVQVTDALFEKYWQQKCLPQVRELIENYHPDLMWFDTWGKPEEISDKRLNELIGLVRELNPNCLINSRILMKHPDIAKKVDYLSMGDNNFPDEVINQAWETSGTMNHSWGYHQRDHHWETSKSLLTKLLGNVSRNGNFQLNIGPMSDGTFPKASIRRLREIGAWMSVNGDAVHGSGTFQPKSDTWGYITCKKQDIDKKRLYLNIVNYPESRELVVKGIKQLPKKVYLLETAEELDFIPYPESAITIKLPFLAIDPNITVVVVEN